VQAIAGGRQFQVSIYDVRALAPYLILRKPYHALGGNYRWRILTTDKPWARPASSQRLRAARNHGSRSGIAVEGSGGLFSVWVISFCGGAWMLFAYSRFVGCLGRAGTGIYRHSSGPDANGLAGL